MWLYVPNLSTSSASAPEAADLISASSWQCQTLAASCSWRGKPSPAATWSQRCNKVSWLRQLCGAMSPPSTAAHGAVLWMVSLAAFRASRTALPASGRDPTTSATCGATQGVSSSSRGRGSSLSRMSKACSRRSPASIRERYGSGVTYSDWVSALRADCLRRQRSARAINASAFSSSVWRTPTDDSRRGGPPIGTETGKRRPHDRFAGQVLDSPTNWPTPTANDWKGSGPSIERADGKMRGDRLDYATEQFWNTPAASYGESHQPGNSRSYNLTMDLAADMYSRLAHPTYEVGQVSSHPRRSLNPLFVEWLMGWPPGWTLLAWTDFACSATALSRWKALMRSELLRLGLPPEAPAEQLGLFA